MEQGASEESRKEVGARLRKLAEDKSYTREEIEKFLRVKKGTVGSYESGLSLPSTNRALRYAVLFNLPLEEIFGTQIARRYERIEKSKMYAYRYSNKREKQGVSEPGRMRIDRKSAGVTLDEMVARINKFWPELQVTKNTLSRMETGMQEKTNEVALAYAQILEKPLDSYDAQDVSNSFDPHRVVGKQEPKPLDSMLDADLETALKHIRPTEADFIKEIYWAEKSLQEISHKQSVTRERVRQKKEQILKKMREFFRRQGYHIKEDANEE